MRFIVRIMMQLQMYINMKKKRRLCLDCNEAVIPRREVSVLNILFYVIIGAVVYFITRNKLSFFLPIILAVINAMLVKPKCPKCRGVNLEK